jgi:hypothetical protein
MIEVLKQMVEALEWCHGGEPIGTADAIQAGKKLIAELESQEPVAWMYQEYRDDDQFGWRDEIQFVQPPNDPNYFRYIVPVYTHPPQRTWVGLTDEEMLMIYGQDHVGKKYSLGRMVQQALKEKNT